MLCIICYIVANVENSIKPIHLSCIIVHNSLFFENTFIIVGIQNLFETYLPFLV